MPYRHATTQVAIEPVDVIARLAALVPKSSVNLTPYHGVLTPHHRWRGRVTPAKRSKGEKRIACIEDQDVIDRILAHLREKEQGRSTLSHLAPPSRAPPGHYLF
jgi:hypothetical protein